MSPLCKTPKCKAAEWHSVSSDPSCATRPRGTEKPPAFSTLGLRGKASSQSRRRECGLSLLGPEAGGLVPLGQEKPPPSHSETALTGLVMGIKNVYVVAGRDRGGNLINIE